MTNYTTGAIFYASVQQANILLFLCEGDMVPNHVETEMTCRRVNKINNIRPFSLFNKRASYRPVL